MFNKSIDNIKVFKVCDYAEMSNLAAEILISEVKNNPNIVLGLATGGTPEGMYKKIVEDHKLNNTSFEGVTSFNLDEYVGLTGDNETSYRHYMDEHLFNHVNINKENTFVPFGVSEDLSQGCLDYEATMKELGPINLQILGIGGNGHIGFNEPGTSFESITHVIDLDQSTIEANARYFNSIDDVPKKAVTMGISTIMRSEKIILLASGASKLDAVTKLLKGEISEDMPASVLRKHPNVIVIVDEEACPEL